MRYFIFFFNFSRPDIKGNGILSFDADGFPSRNIVTNEMLKLIQEKAPSVQFEDIVITNFKELSESDFNNWTTN